MSMRIETEEKENARIMRITGKIDIMSSAELRSKLNDFIKSKTDLLVVDMSQVSYLDSSGLATFLEGLKGIKEYGGRMKFACMPEKIEKVLRLMKLDIVFEIVDDVDSAISKKSG